jgi:hypothetical protein
VQELSPHDKRRLLSCLNCEAVLAFLPRRKGVEQTDDHEYRGERGEQYEKSVFWPYMCQCGDNSNAHGRVRGGFCKLNRVSQGKKEEEEEGGGCRVRR